MFKQRRENQSKGIYLPPLFLLLFFCLGGILLGQVYTNRISENVILEIKQYLKDYVSLDDVPYLSSEAFLSNFLGYFRYPVISFLLGFSSVGVFLLPVLAFVFGFFLSFSVSCFTAAYVGHGVLISLAVLGLRCIVTLPCFFIVSVFSFKKSAELLDVTFGRGRRTARTKTEKGHFKCFAVLVMVLLLSVCVDLFISSHILRWVLKLIST
jgi:stage II sporulation protein M